MGRPTDEDLRKVSNDFGDVVDVLERKGYECTMTEHYEDGQAKSCFKRINDTTTSSIDLEGFIVNEGPY